MLLCSVIPVIMLPVACHYAPVSCHNLTLIMMWPGS